MSKGKNVRVRGRWWHYQFEIEGRDYSGSTGLEGSERNRSAAESYAERVRQSILHPAPELVATEDPARKGFSVAAEQFLSWAENVEYRGKPNTAARLRTSMASCKVYFGDRPVRGIAPVDLEGYKEFRVREHGVRDITIRHDLHALSRFFRYAMKHEWAESNPVKEVKIPSDRDAVREHVVSAEEEAKYLATALELHAGMVQTWSPAEKDKRLPNMHDLAVLMLEQGARPEELLSARVADVDLEAGTLTIAGGKTRAARRVLDLTARSRAVLERRVAGGSQWLFPSEIRLGRHVTKLNNTHDRVCREAGVSFVMYDFRHTWATRMIAAGVDVPTVAAILGHSGLRTIYRYVHPTAEAKKRAMERFEAAGNRLRLKVVG